MQLKQDNSKMELKILQENQNLLFDRKEIQADIKSESTPSKTEVAKVLAEKFSVPEEAIKIVDIQGKFGEQVFKLNANIYSSKEEKDKVEIKTKQEKEAEKKAIEDARKAEEIAKADAEVAKKEEEAKKAEAEKSEEAQKENTKSIPPVDNSEPESQSEPNKESPSEDNKTENPVN